MAVKQGNLKKFFDSSIKKIKDTFIGTADATFEKGKQAAIQWLRDRIDAFRKEPDPKKDINDYVMRYPGTFYMFQYASKLYEQGKLKFYDGYPLILVLELDKIGFLGINFHYLIPKYRALLLDRIMRMYPRQFVQNEILKPMTYDIFISRLGGFKKYIKPAIKRYLWSHVLKMRGLTVMRIKNNDMLQTLLYRTPEWVDTSQHDVEKWIKDRIK